MAGAAGGGVGMRDAANNRRGSRSPRPVGESAMLSVSSVVASGAAYYAKDDHYFGRENVNRAEPDARAEEGNDSPVVVTPNGALGRGDGSAVLTWGGKGAARLGLSGSATLDDFHAVLAGRNPDPDGPPLSMKERHERRGNVAIEGGSAGIRSHHRAGIDLTFSAPKSVSIAALVGGDARIVRLHDQAVGKVMDYIENHHALTRRRTGDGGFERVKVDNLVYARTTHSTSRAGDPQLHTHVVVSNAVYDARSGQWRALDNKEIFSNQVMLGLMYQREIAGGLMKEGFDVRSANNDGKSGKDGMFEIADCPSPLMVALSKRDQQIQKNIAELNPNTPAAFAVADLKGRPKKLEMPARDLIALWEKTAAAYGFNPRDWVASKTPSAPGKDISAHQFGQVPSVALAVHKITESVREVLGRSDRDPYGYATGYPVAMRFPAARGALSDALQVSEAKSAVFTKGDVFRIAMRIAPADVTLGALDREWRMLVADRRIQQADLTVHEGVTTARSLRIEADIALAVRNGLGQSEPLYDAVAGVRRTLSGLTVTEGGRLRLGEDQVRAVALILGSPDKIIGVQGVAGAGKSAIFGLVGEAAREKGVTIVGMAPTHSAADALVQKAGFEVLTVQRFLALGSNIAERQARPTGTQLRDWRGKIVVLDEASMIDNVDKLRVIKLVDALDIRKLILVGDRGQLPAITAGAPFTLLLETMIPHAVVDTLRRQRNPELRAAVGDLARGNSQGLAHLRGEVIEAGDRADAVALASKAHEEWTTAHNQGVTRPIITVSQEQRSLVNGMILDGLEASGEITRLGPARDTLVQNHLVGPERWRADSYSPGQVLVFHSRLDSAGISKGEHAIVVGVDSSKTGNILAVRRENGKVAMINLSALRRRGEDKFVPYQSHSDRPLYSGATFVFERTNTDSALNVRAGEAFTVLGQANGRIELRLSSGREIDLPVDHKQLLFVGPGYAMTTHRSQGLTTDVDPIAILGSRNSTMASAYVQVSRGVNGITIVTDSFDSLVRNIAQRSGHNLIATFNLRPEALRSRGMAEPRAEEAIAAFDPSLNKPEPEKSINLDRPHLLDRSL